MMKIIGIIGKTASGKDTVMRYLQKQYQIDPIVSYTTRKPRESEINGREHWFVDDMKMDDLLSNKTEILAFMENPKTNRRYCSSIHGLDEDRTYTYLINPIAWERMVAEHPEIEFVGIYCDLDEKTIKNRALLRGDHSEDIEARLDDERDEFDSFKMKIIANGKMPGPPIYILPTAGSREVMFSAIDNLKGYLF